ncbi:MAG: helix-turn-helix domain-containing protein [Oxalobacter sp.]|nr:helix-turn-helix domain-containing protein [Oxalobacter sp.]
MLIPCWTTASHRCKAAAKFGIAAACTVSRWERLYRQGGIIALQSNRKGRPRLPEKKANPVNTMTTLFLNSKPSRKRLSIFARRMPI